MTGKGDRYFDGYERVSVRDSDGTERRVLQYTAEWYGYEDPGAQKRMKLAATLLTGVLVLSYFYAQLHPAAIGMMRYMAIPSLLSLVPMIFLVIGLANFLLAKEKWELHTYYAGYRRLLRSTVAELILLAIWTAMELVSLCITPGLFRMELGYLLCALVSTGASAALLILLRKNSPQVVDGPTIR